MNKYKKVYLGKNNGVSISQEEHRYVMEQYLKRKLLPSEIVHHKDGNKSNNVIENLEIMTRSEHTRLHNKGKKMSKEFCQKISKRMKNKPNYNNRQRTKEDIINIILKYKELKNYREVDRFFNFSNGTTGEIIRGQIYYDYQPLIKELLEK